ncbi:MAG: cation transporter [Armatimonadetes bacterium]|nr:cation transporter [Armatimonadota bacterium]
MASGAAETSAALTRAALASVASNLALLVAKTVVGLSTGSLSVLGEAVHSGSDLLASVLALTAVRTASRPADHDHPFGHGKYESLSATLEGLILLAAALGIAVEAGKRLAERGGQEIIAAPGIAVMAAGVFLNIALSTYLLRLAAKHSSPALHADGVHLRADVWTSLAVLVGLVAMHLGAAQVVDTALAVLVAAVVLIEGVTLTLGGIEDLLDAALPPREREIIEQVLARHRKHYVDYHKLRARRSGRNRLADVHVVVCQQLTVGEAHDISEELQQAVAEALPNTELVVHIEPCDSVECLERIRRGERVECKRLAGGEGKGESGQ